jgi:hypothetical protein
MQKIRQPIALLFLFSITILLSGCQANLEWFIRNVSNKEVLLTLRYEANSTQPLRHPLLPLKNNYVDFKKEVLSINYETTHTMNDSLKIMYVNDSTYQVHIPAKSTVELTYIIPTDYGYNANTILEFNQQGHLFAINANSVFEKHTHFHTKGKGILKNLVYYDYGKE